MSADNTRIFECFKAGTHTTMGGQTAEWSFADLDRICNNYLYRTDRAPLVIGHPLTNGPAYGEVTELFHKRGGLYAVAKVGKELLELVKRGYYKHVSASFAHASGLPGWSLRHIGFLGATTSTKMPTAFSRRHFDGWRGMNGKRPVSGNARATRRPG
jgi:hypothetical protein